MESEFTVTKKEFIEQRRSKNRKLGKAGLIFGTFFLVDIFGLLALLGYAEGNPEYLWMKPYVNGAIIFSLICSYALLVWTGLKQQMKYGYRCPGCGRIISGVNTPIAIASGNCGNCGAKVFDDDAKPQASEKANVG